MHRNVSALVRTSLGALALIAALIVSLNSSGRCDPPKPMPFLLGPDDEIEVTVRNHSELNRVVTIQPDGKLNFPEVGEVEAAGKTTVELAEIIRKELDKTRNNVAVVITVRQIKSRRVRIIGSAVKQQGGYDLRPNWRLLDLIAAAGGLSGKPNRINGRIIRADGTLLPLEVAQAISKPDTKANVPLTTDDLVLLDELDPILNQAYVMGQVVRTGAVQLDPETNIVSMMAQSGGPTILAALTKAYVSRGNERIPLNLISLTKEGKTDPEIIKFQVLPGDVLYIPEIEQKIAVAGAVLKPEYYPYPETKKLTVLEAYYGAGGGYPNSEPSKAVILRNVGGKTTSTPVNIDKILKKADLAANVELKPNDVLYIPSRSGKRGISLQDTLTPFSILSFLGLRLFR